MKSLRHLLNVQLGDVDESLVAGKDLHEDPEVVHSSNGAFSACGR